MNPLLSWLAANGLAVPAFSPVPTFSPVMVLGLLGIALGSVWTLFHDRRAILLCQAACSASFAAHYALLGARTAPVMCLLSVIQVLVASPARRPRWVGMLYGSTIAAATVDAALTWQGATSAAAAFGLGFTTIGRWQIDMVRLRLCFVASGFGWMTHNVMVGSPYGLATDTLSMAGNLWFLWLVWRAGRRPWPAAVGVAPRRRCA